jgi:hypothetical protein
MQIAEAFLCRRSRLRARIIRPIIIATGVYVLIRLPQKIT